MQVWQETLNTAFQAASQEMYAANKLQVKRTQAHLEMKAHLRTATPKSPMWILKR